MQPDGRPNGQGESAHTRPTSANVKLAPSLQRPFRFKAKKGKPCGDAVMHGIGVNSAHASKLVKLPGTFVSINKTHQSMFSKGTRSH